MNRRIGSFLVFFLFLVILTICSRIGCAQCNKLDIVILGDFSGSVVKNEKFVLSAIRSFVGVLDRHSVRVGVVFFNHAPKILSGLSNNPIDIFKSLEQYESVVANGSTDIEGALQTGVNVLLEDQSDSKKILILISDGDDTITDTNQILATSNQINNLGIGICSVLIKNESSRAEFMKEVASGCYVESSYENLAVELKNLNICL